VREEDGLALSSRNAYLDSEERRAAGALYRALQAACREIAADIRDVQTLQNTVFEVLEREKLARVDYVEIVDADSFEPVVRIGSRSTYILLAVFIGKTRLVDNVLIEPAPDSGELIWSL
jgi:pantoate--beta-alanine ligase